MKEKYGIYFIHIIIDIAGVSVRFAVLSPSFRAVVGVVTIGVRKK
ncbi:hypothetical protein [Mucilaginibacter celer]|nr:hypothetical protein [Mucilaginibacter celer]